MSYNFWHINFFVWAEKQTHKFTKNYSNKTDWIIKLYTYRCTVMLVDRVVL